VRTTVEGEVRDLVCDELRGGGAEAVSDALGDIATVRPRYPPPPSVPFSITQRCNTL
jgi:hypothetical protein